MFSFNEIAEMLKSDIKDPAEYVQYAAEVLEQEICGLNAKFRPDTHGGNMPSAGNHIISAGEAGRIHISYFPEMAESLIPFFRIIELETEVRLANSRLRRLEMSLADTDTETLEKLRVTQAALIRQEKLASLGQLSSGVAHELNNPLGFISGNFDVLKNYRNLFLAFLMQAKGLIPADRLPEYEELKHLHRVDYLLQDTEDIFKESSDGFRRISHIVEGLLPFARNDTGRMEPASLNDSIESTVDICRSQFRFVAKVTKELEDIPDFEFCSGEINQVLLNLILNSVQAIKAQERDDYGTIAIRSFKFGNMACCSVTDDGGGISEEDLDRIFSAFYTTKPENSGTGLGLSTSYEIIVNRHKGTIDAESCDGKTTFTFRIPMRTGGR